jgi:hypothetical protein
MAVSLPTPPHGGFGIETVKKFNGYMQRPFPNGHKRPFGCNGHATAVAVGQRQRLYSGVRIFTGLYLSFF